MKHVKNFQEFITKENPAADPETETKKKSPEDADVDSPEDDTADDPQPDTEKAPETDEPASDAADDVEDEVEDDTEIEEGNAFSAALKKAKEDGEDEFEVDGKTFKVKESSIKKFDQFLEENFTMYPSYNNMIGSEVLRDVPITHQVNMSVYGKENVIDQELPEPVPAVVDKEEDAE